MKVILKQDVAKLGKKGDLVEVSDGYARNFLFPRQLAEEGTAGKVKDWENQEDTKRAKAEKAEQHAREVGRHLQGKRVVVKASAGDAGKLFGSVTSAQVAEAIATQLGAKVDKKDLRLPEALRSVGVYPVTVRLHAGVETSLTVSVEAE
ncbi:MAG TPA: 50S ribosomal protein L9 [Synergistaceae bacterium]|jgi:large subunit ribosomal protein L9|nr:MAG: 50S ribosomal protein L9 [Synergistetes bacterium ADurb.Bin520]HOU32381.1 50S ribosomal protein L9 [Synergistaceae bacterium]HQF91350.1 50S ribosomal protein L9 [Synergistaceae bacterium]HQH78350.1 50S ribosomal protein L9 [Synergistaceae bacterium]HQK24509.1 50S ribosomal protein L9 [Synergistaceae bacterium]